MAFLNSPQVGQQRSLQLLTFYRSRTIDRQIRPWLPLSRPVPPNTRRGSTTSHDIGAVPFREVNLILQNIDVEEDDFTDETDSDMTYDDTSSLASFDLLDSLPAEGYSIIHDDRNSADRHDEYDADSEDDYSVSCPLHRALWNI